MNKKFDIITMVLMTVLVVILIMVMFNYFTRENDFLAQNSNSHLELIHTIPSGDLIPDKIDIIDRESGDMPSGDEVSGDDIIASGDEDNQSQVIQPSGNNITSGNDNKNPTTPVIMTSDDEISNKEKKEILKELDQTLMELLDVVDKVQTVDESRLTDEESEVQK